MSGTEEDRLRAIALGLTEGIGITLAMRLLAYFGSLAAILDASSTALRRVRGIGPRLSERIRCISLDQTATDLARWEQQDVTVATWLEAAYPAALVELQDRPLLIFRRGVAWPGQPAGVAIVGTRQASAVSLRLAHMWSARLAQQGHVVVSGLARGVDTAAHRGALEGAPSSEKRARTWAVLGSGVNRIYPPENAQLAEQVALHGALLSEVAPDATPTREALTLRNRLIAALCRVLIVVEAGPTSGALHAALRAQAAGRPVYALPGSGGNDELLRTFAHPLPTAPGQLPLLLADS